ncbi:MAG: hypothetical protein GX136_08450 [Clostridiales bacterium]|nr:hypothetical protein [Clostridiales bacterium]
MKPTGKVALGGVLAALSLTFMLLTFFPFATYALPAIAGAVLIPFVVEVNAKSAWLVYAAVAILSLFISPDIEAKTLFISLFGYYPILKSLLERIRSRRLEWVLKLAVFNIAVVVSYLLLLFVIGIDADSFGIVGKYAVYAMLAVGNIVFVLYDITLTSLIALYMRTLHPRVFKMFNLKR